MTEFELFLARARVLDANVEEHHDAKRLEVEHAMILTLKTNGIILPKSFMAVGKDFKPKLPLLAMDIRQFDKMAVEDQADYIQRLVEVAEKVLIDYGQKDLAAKVYRLFTEISPGDKMPLGMAEFKRSLARERLADAERNDNAQRIQVEDAMAVTLEKNGIELPHSFMTVAKDFKPKHPPK